MMQIVAIINDGFIGEVEEKTKGSLYLKIADFDTLSLIQILAHSLSLPGFKLPVVPHILQTKFGSLKHQIL